MSEFESVSIGSAHDVPISDEEVVYKAESGSQVVRQDYADGTQYELRMKLGSPATELFQYIPENSVVLGAWDPADTNDAGDENLYLSVWVPGV